MAGPSPPNIKTQASTPNIANIASPEPDSAIPSTETLASTYPDTSLFTIIPDLYLLFSRISELRNVPQSTTNGNGTSDPTTTNTTQATTSGQSRHRDSNSSSLTQTLSRDSQGSLKHVSSAEASIEIRDLPAHVYDIKQKIARARDVVRSLPDVERSVEQQEKEMEDLRRKIRGLQGRLGELGEIAGQKEDVVMSGIEGG